MPRLVLTFNDQVIKEYHFLKESVTIGRNSDNTIVAVRFKGEDCPK